MIVENLRQFGLNEKEISVYLSLISLGHSPVREISKTANVNRGTTYDILKSLIELGLVSHYKQDTKQHFVAEPPQKILDAIENKKRSLDTVKDQFKKSLPELASMYEKSGAKPVVKYYEGNSGVRTILQDVIATTKESDDKTYYIYSSADVKKHIYKAYPKFTEDRIENKVKVKAIAMGEGGEMVGLDERKWLSKKGPSSQGETEAEVSPSYIFVYHGKTAMISIDALGQPVGVIIENEGLSQTQKMVFERLWEVL